MPEPRIINLASAVAQIKQVCEEDKKAFFFFTGSGLSHPPIPLAAAIIEHCEAEAKKRYNSKDCTKGQLIDEYSYWFNEAYPQPRQRQRYLRGLIEGKPISHANLRLAHLLLEKSITNLVVTTNFDDFLSRALILFGEKPVVCDHPKTVGRIDPDATDIQIVHVHGTYWFYDCCNLKDEIKKRSSPSPDTTATMAALLDRLLSKRAPIVLGYGGWEGDVFMSALERRLLSDPLPYNIYWFCHKEADIQPLPDWLKTSRYVNFVVPPKAPGAEGEGAVPAPQRKQASVQFLAPDSAKEKEAEKVTLTAKKVLDTLIGSFGLDPPKLTSDPLGFFAEHLKASVFPDTGDEGDIYFFSGVINRINRAKDREKTEKVSEKAPLEEIFNAMRSSQYREAIKLAAVIDIAAISKEQARELASAMWVAAMALSDNSEEELTGYNMVIRLGDAFGDSTEPTLLKRVARAMFKKGFTLGALHRYDEAIAVYDEVVRRFGAAKEPELLKQLAMAMFNRAVALGALNRNDEAIAAYDEVVRRFGDAKEPALLENVAMAMVNKGNRLGTLNRLDEAITVYDEVVRRFGDAKEPALLEAVAKAMVNMGVRLGALNRLDEAIAVHDEAIRRFGEAKEIELLKHVAMAMVNKGNRLGALNRDDEAIAVYDEVVRRFGDAKEPELLKQVAIAMVNRGATLGVLSRTDEAIAVYNEVVRRFGDAKEPGIAEVVEIARTLREELKKPDAYPPRPSPSPFPRVNI